MKKILLAGIISVALLTACKNEVPSAPAEPAAVPSTPAPALPETPEPEVPQQKEGTSVQIGPDGVKVQNKNGDKKTGVKVEDGKITVDARSPQ
ncbi:hypothetical protein [Flavobacterium sp.]|uniref:hypothetical protein n=1 Tax=Flavobacterium sp. TaxID=239 RepID=UPI0039E22EEF